MKKHFSLAIITTLTISFFINLDQAQAKNSQEKWQAYTNLNLKEGTSRTIGRLDFFLPLKQNNDSMVFLDVRGVRDSQQSKEGNFGLGYREIVRDKDFIWGVYGFYDRRQSPNGKVYHQGTFGLEYLNENWDFRANHYMPDDGEKTIGLIDTPHDATFSGGTIQYRASTEFKEQAMKGYDLEIGRQQFLLPKLSFYTAFYRFEGDGVKDIDGIRMRSEYDINDNLILHLESSKDRVRKDENFVGLSYRIFLDDKNPPRLAGLDKRMLEPVVRDIDIVTGEQTVQGEMLDVTNADGSTTNVIYVDNSVAIDGDGSFGSPRNDLASALSTAGANDVIFVYAGSGAYDAANVSGFSSSNDGQRIIGEGSGLTFDINGQTLTAIAAGDQPQLINSVGDDGDTLYDAGEAIFTIASDDVELSGFRISLTDNNILDGIYINNQTGFNINNNTIDSGGVDASASRRFGNGPSIGGAINIAVASDVKDITGNIANNNISSSTTKLNNHSGNGILLSTNYDYSVNNKVVNVNITENTISHNVNGVRLNSEAGSNSAQVAFNVSKNSFIENKEHGINAASNGQSDLILNVDQNTMTSNGKAYDGVDDFSAIKVSSTSSHADNSITFVATNNTIDGDVESNVVHASRGFDFVLSSGSAATFNVTVQNNSFINIQNQALYKNRNEISIAPESGGNTDENSAVSVSGP